VTLLLWVPLMILWLWLLLWEAAGLNEAHARGVNVEPSDLLPALPIFFMGLAWTLSGPAVRWLERCWRGRGC
jgi:hypothetical protein